MDVSPPPPVANPYATGKIVSSFFLFGLDSLNQELLTLSLLLALLSLNTNIRHMKLKTILGLNNITPLQVPDAIDCPLGLGHHREEPKTTSGHHSHRHSSCSERKAFWGCGAQVPEGKSLCEPCYTRAVKEREDGHQQESLVRRVVRESLSKLDRTHNPAGNDLEAPGPSQPSHSSIIIII